MLLSDLLFDTYTQGTRFFSAEFYGSRVKVAYG